MKVRTLILSVFSLLLIACGETQEKTPTTTDSEISTAESQENPSSEGIDLKGLYTAGGHDQAWAVSVDQDNSGWYVMAAEIDGMLPPLDEIFNYPEEIRFERLESFVLDETNYSFTSSWGKGKFENGQMIFEDKKDWMDETAPLSLSKHK